MTARVAGQTGRSAGDRGPSVLGSRPATQPQASTGNLNTTVTTTSLHTQTCIFSLLEQEKKVPRPSIILPGYPLFLFVLAMSEFRDDAVVSYRERALSDMTFSRKLIRVARVLRNIDIPRGIMRC